MYGGTKDSCTSTGFDPDFHFTGTAHEVLGPFSVQERRLPYEYKIDNCERLFVESPYEAPSEGD